MRYAATVRSDRKAIMKIAAVLAVLAFAISCSRAEPTVAATTKPPVAAPAAPATPAASANQLAGPIAETFNSGGYTYVRVGNEWAAVPETKLEKGAQVAIDAQMTLENFESKSLNRTFDRIVFGSIAGAKPAAHSAAMPPADTPAQHMQAPASIDVSVAPAPGGKTVQQVWQQKASLAGKEVVVRGKVVKALTGIMGTNWIHLQDGTGSQATGDNDLTVTTDAKVSTGDVVTIRGVLTVDKDFGMGYRYDVIVQKASVTP
jgi:hypothetical protein